MLYREIIAVCSQTHTKHTNTLCGQNVDFFNVKSWRYIKTPTGLFSSYMALQSNSGLRLLNGLLPVSSVFDLSFQFVILQ